MLTAKAKPTSQIGRTIFMCFWYYTSVWVQTFPGHPRTIWCSRIYIVSVLSKKFLFLSNSPTSLADSVLFAYTQHTSIFFPKRGSFKMRYARENYPYLIFTHDLRRPLTCMLNLSAYTCSCIGWQIYQIYQILKHTDKERRSWSECDLQADLNRDSAHAVRYIIPFSRWMGRNTPGSFSAILDKRDIFCDFLFAFTHSSKISAVLFWPLKRSLL